MTPGTLHDNEPYLATSPIRLQRKRTKGFKLESPNGLPIAYVGRPSRWGNPFRIGVDGDARECVRKYAELMLPYSHHGENSGLEAFFISEANLTEMTQALKGKNLSCFCPLDQPCHADTLLAWVNARGMP